MILEQLGTLNTGRPARDFKKILLKKQRSVKRSLLRTQRHAIATIRRQYYLTNAVADSYRAFRLNEDIALASLLVIGVISFSTISILGNALYTIMITAVTLSFTYNANIALMVLSSVVVIAVVVGWLLAMLQNMLSISLMDGLNRKRDRSLLKTLRRSLGLATQTAGAWLLLLLAAFIPVGAVLLAAMGILSVGDTSPADVMPALVGLGAMSLVWVLWVIANYALLPYALLFNKTDSIGNTLELSRQLVDTKGRGFILAGLVMFIAVMAGLYALAEGLEKLTQVNSSLTMMLLGAGAITGANAIMTVFYRKRRMARR